MKILLFILILFAALYLYAWYREKVFLQHFNKFFLEKEGSNYLFYNDRKGLKKFIESNVIDRLSNRIDLIYLAGKEIDCNEGEKEFLTRILFNLKNYSKFPHLVKVRNGRIEDMSINNKIFNCMNQGKNISTLIDDINRFFEI